MIWSWLAKKVLPDGAWRHDRPIWSGIFAPEAYFRPYAEPQSAATLTPQMLEDLWEECMRDYR